MAHDELASAYAAIGVRRDAPIADVQRAYRKLVRTWHPDRFTNDPQGFAEATVEMRVINHAYDLILRSREAALSIQSEDQQLRPAENSPLWQGTGTLSRDQIGRIVGAINRRDSFVDAIMREPINRSLSLLVVILHFVIVIRNELRGVLNLPTSVLGVLTLPFLLLYIWSDKTSAKIFGWFWLVTYVVLLPMFGMFTGFYRVK
jgi:hypothetical protein